jgi:hypothetical protein
MGGLKRVSLFSELEQSLPSRGSSVSKQAQPYTPDLPGKPNFGGSEGCLKSQGDHGKAQLARVDGAATIRVEEKEGLPDVCLLLLR